MNTSFPFIDLITGRFHTVSQINRRIKQAVEEEVGYEDLWVVGEISDFREHRASGHWYFSLKDEESQIGAVAFRWVTQYIKFKPEIGMEVICCGRVEVYEKGGKYQIIVRYVEPRGVGAGQIALEQLKEKLLQEGLLDPSRKRAIPFFPQRIGVVTSPSGAAIRDVLKVLGRRFPNLEVIISPTRVQGQEAPREIVQALERLYLIPGLDLIIVARGGGSKEDLWAFNEEAVARKIAASPIPVISAIGHEIDITISDLVADVRASTPSMAAEIAVKEKDTLVQELVQIRARIAVFLEKILNSYRRDLVQTQAGLFRSTESRIKAAVSELEALSGRLDVLSPLKVLERGYSITHKLPSMEIVKESKELAMGDEIIIRLYRGKARCRVEETED